MPDSVPCLKYGRKQVETIDCSYRAQSLMDKVDSKGEEACEWEVLGSKGAHMKGA